MGCRESKVRSGVAEPRDPVYFRPDGTPKLTPEAAQFLDMSASDPIARIVLEKWSIFVYQQTAVTPLRKRGVGAASCSPESAPPVPMLDGLTSPTFRFDGGSANQPDSPMFHPDVDRVGRLAVQYLRMDLVHRGWKGTVRYLVEGGMNDGVLTVMVDATSLEKNWTADSHDGKDNALKFEVTVRYYATVDH